ncbi:flavin-containing monooxygenase [Phenylobacterium montanum]|uniref:NAD(P)/FAD-dependent oxidoreductase n=1 Tax=Phenylobacterium montanum TaxID=2823693 RepID=A0A975G2Z9_9CAUL|nr:NAD(P)/FAD-dependent oxidoreductase [Caulobacter sp. S6]QUD89617.1 NAD(P)/FAD-dependent oxidoreductase [Caulobacter sp. S6]
MTDLTLGTWLAEFEKALTSGEAARSAELFEPDGFWRDFVAFTWNLLTLEGRSAIRGMLEATTEARRSRNWRVVDTAASSGQEGFVSFDTALGRGTGYVRLKQGRCWTLFTTLQDLTGFEQHVGRHRRKGPTLDPRHPQWNWLDTRKAEQARIGVEDQPFVLIVGGGQAGLTLAARLRQLDVPALVVERNVRPGDQWRSRYHSLSLHDPVWYDHMPYLPFPETWPVFTPKDQIADWLDAYAQILELNVWGSTECLRAAYDASEQIWRVEVRRAGDQVTLRPRHLVIATGNAGRPNMPRFEGAETFAGPIMHSSQYSGGRGYEGRKVAVIGSNNSAHDICADLVEHGADATMIQRSSTHVVRSQTVLDLLLSGLYSETALASGITTERADLLSASMPLRLAPEIHRPLNLMIAQRDAEFYARLEAAGFMHDFGEDGTGMALKYLRRASGYYIDVGASDLVASGRIKLRSRVGVERFVPEGVLLSDGSTVSADLIICATGFGSMDQVVGDLVSEEVAAKVGKVWGYGSDTAHDPGPWEGELRNMWKPTAQEGLWFHGGNLAQSRFYSLFLALQLKARLEKLPIRVFGRAQPTATDSADSGDGLERSPADFGTYPQSTN